MTQQEAEALFDKYRRGETTEGENALIESWYLHVARQSRQADGRIDYEGKINYEGKEQQIWAKIQEKKALVKEKKQGVEKRRPRTGAPSIAWKIASRGKLGIRQVWLASAAAVAAITLGVWLFYASGILGGRHPELVSGSPNYANDIAPGKNTATLTLASGEVINLSDAKTGVVIDASSLKYSDGTSLLSSRANAKDLNTDPSKLGMTSVSTPRGGQYQVVLPDGTKVWLNADTKISFPSQFSGKERKIVMEGEAYFEVAKLTRSSLRGGTTKQSHHVIASSRKASRNDDRVPFIVESKGQRVEVLGTHFNVNTYEEEKGIGTRTTLLEGSVKVTAADGHTLLLKPGVQAYYSPDGLRGLQVDTELAVAWKNNKFMFEEQNIQAIMKMIERWYNVEVVYAGDMPDRTFSGSVSRFDNISKVLSILELTDNVHFKIEGRRVTVQQ